MCNTNGEGVAVCSCGSQLEVRCMGGCPEPDAVFKSVRAAIRKPQGREVSYNRKKKVRRFRPGFCTYPGCDDPIAPRPPKSVGHPWTKCFKHLQASRRYTANRAAVKLRVVA